MLKIEEIDVHTASLTFDGYRTCYVVRDLKTVLVDCGYPADHPGLLEGLERLGLDPGDIDYLALTHIHLDHAGGAGYLTRLNPELVVMRLTAGEVAILLIPPDCCRGQRKPMVNISLL